MFWLSFFLVAGPQLSFGDLFLISNGIFFIASIGYIFRNGVSSTLSVLFVSLFLGVIISLFKTILFPELGAKWSLQFIKMIVYLVNAFVLVELYHDVYRQNYYRKIIAHLLKILVLLSVFSLTMLYEPLRLIILPYLTSELSSSVEVIHGIRGIDFSVGGGMALSLILFFGVCLWILGYQERFYSFHTSIIPLIFISSTILAARTGFLLILGYLVILVVSKLRSILGDGIVYKRTVKSVLVTFGFFVLIFVNFSTDDLEAYSDIVSWAFEMFINMADSGSGTTVSTTRLFDNHYHLNLDSWAYLFGSLSAFDHTDVGYLAVVYGLGIPGLLVILIYFGAILRSLLACKGYIRVVAIIFLVAIIIVNFKGMVLANSRGVWMVFCVIIFLCFKRRQFNSAGG